MIDWCRPTPGLHLATVISSRLPHDFAVHSWLHYREIFGCHMSSLECCDPVAWRIDPLCAPGIPCLKIKIYTLGAVQIAVIFVP
jgi:hypothetical protein